MFPKLLESKTFTPIITRQTYESKPTCFTRYKTQFCLPLNCLNGWIVGDFIAQGSYGQVFYAFHPIVKTHALIKFSPLKVDQKNQKYYENVNFTNLKRYKHEIKNSIILSKLNLGPRIYANWLCSGWETNQPNIKILFGILVMEHIPGITLEKFLKTNKISEPIENAFRNLLKTWSQHGWTFTDDHPGNIIININHQGNQNSGDLTNQKDKKEITLRTIDVGFSEPRSLSDTEIKAKVDELKKWILW